MKQKYLYLCNKFVGIMRKLWLVLLLTFTIVAHAQNGDFVRAYMDSLAQAQMRVADNHRHIASPIQDKKLFFPLTFYRDIAHEAFTLDERLSPLYQQLLRVYLAHPEWVRNTEWDIAHVDNWNEIELKPMKPVMESIPFPEHADIDKLAQQVTSSIPVNVAIQKPNFWKFKGDFSLSFMQNYVSSNWYQGGQSNYAMMTAVTLEANYNNKHRVKWDNKLEIKLGALHSSSDTIHQFLATDNLLRYTGKLGLQATKKWYYTLQLMAETQLTHGYKANDPKLYSDFLAPLTVNLSLGMDYTVDWLNHKLKGNVHLAPAALNMKYTRLLELSKHLGIDEGKHALFDYGSQFTVDFEWQLLEQLKWKSRLYGFTSYKRVELEWENTFNFQLTRWLSAQLFVYPRFDDSVKRDGHHGYFQIKENASIGFAYSF